MSDPAIGIGHWMSVPPVPARGSAQDPAQVRPAGPGFHGAVFGILHTPYRFQKSEIQNRESGKAISPRYERFHLDEVDDGAVGWEA